MLSTENNQLGAYGSERSLFRLDKLREVRLVVL